MFFGMAGFDDIGDSGKAGGVLISSGSNPSSGIDWNAIIARGFNFGTTFLNDKYAKDASRSTGTYNPQSVTPTQAYQPLPSSNTSLTSSTSNSNNPLSLDRALQGVIGFVQKNLLLVGGGIAFYLAMKRDPNKRRT